jgi:hypothetical protein
MWSIRTRQRIPSCSRRWQDFGKSLPSGRPRGQHDGGGELASSCESNPHWDNDMPDNTPQMLEPSARKAVFFDNAARAFRL